MYEVTTYRVPQSLYRHITMEPPQFQVVYDRPSSDTDTQIWGNNNVDGIGTTFSFSLPTTSIQRQLQLQDHVINHISIAILL
jgi:hypothetical protein